MDIEGIWVVMDKMAVIFLVSLSGLFFFILGVWVGGLA